MLDLLDFITDLAADPVGTAAALHACWFVAARARRQVINAGRGMLSRFKK